jgi:CRISPR-associated endonuclease Csn1
VDACVIGVTDQGLLQRFAAASASAREGQLDRLVASMPMPWGTDLDRRYFNSVQRAIENIWVSHKPDHGYEGAMHEETAWGIRPDGQSTRRVRDENGQRDRETKNRALIPIASSRDPNRHGFDEAGQPKAYKGYVGGSNYCIEIIRTESGKWEGEIVSTFTAYQVIREFGASQGLSKLRSPKISLSGKPLVMRLQNGDLIRLESDKGLQTMRVIKMGSNGQIFFASHQEANVDARNNQKDDPFVYVSKYAGSLKKAQGRRVTLSPIGQLRDPGFQG